MESWLSGGIFTGAVHTHGAFHRRQSGAILSCCDRYGRIDADQYTPYDQADEIRNHFVPVARRTFDKPVEVCSALHFISKQASKQRIAQQVHLKPRQGKTLTAGQDGPTGMGMGK